MALPKRELEVKNVESSLGNFKKDVLEGLSKRQKKIPSIYFYDERGSELFTQITKHQDYYLTECELSILEKNKKTLSSFFKKESLNLIEFGPGEGIKTALLIEQFLQDNLDFKYIPIDISREYLASLKRKLQDKFEKLVVEPKNKDYLEGLDDVAHLSNRRNLILFLGSSIGNLDNASALTFLGNIAGELNDGDYILIGFDLCKKNISTLIKAYNDGDGITRAFNLNLLERMNRELGADFIIENFYHYGTYNPEIKAMESYLISLKEQEVKIRALNKTFRLEAFEAIHVEYSHKYTSAEIQTLAREAGFEVIENYLDTQNYYMDSLWRLNKK